jgi:hypothetical protein
MPVSDPFAARIELLADFAYDPNVFDRCPEVCARPPSPP